MTAACNVCHCFDGRMTCKTAKFSNCGETLQAGLEKDPDYNGGIEKRFEDYDTFYDDYEEYNSGTMVTNCHILLKLVLVLYWYASDSH